MSRTIIAEPESRTDVSSDTAPSGFGDLSHALRNPIATIQNYCELMLSCPPEDENERRDFVRTIAEEAEHLSRLVTDLVDLERARTSPPNDEACDLRDAVRRATLSLHALASERGVDVDLELGDNGAIPVVVASPARIERIVLALVENAIRFSPAGDKVLVELVREPDQTWLVAVTDSGSGIPVAAVPRIFDKFYRAVAAPDADRFKSSGLGLTVARAFAEQAGGSLTHEPSRRGARFAIRLPARS